jgi:hypothetical protein
MKNVEDDTQKLFDLEYGKKHTKTWKMRNTRCRIWNRARNFEKIKK